MGFRRIAAFAAVALIGMVCAATASADTMVVAGHRTISATRFVFEGDDIFAPLLPALRPLVKSFSILPDAVKITTLTGQEIAISRERPEATVDGTLHAMPALPKLEKGFVLLPVKALGSLLGCAVRWEEQTRTLYLHPWVRDFVVEARPDRYRVVVGAAAPLRYRAWKEQNPARLVVDLADVDLADVPSSFAIDKGYLQYARIAQKALAPEKEGDLVRLVVGVAEWKPYRIEKSADGCKLQIDLPLPDQELPSDAPPVTLLDVSFRRYSSQLALLTISTSGKARVTSGEGENSPTIWVDVENAENQPKLPDPFPMDRLVKGVTLAPVEGKPKTQRLALLLAEATPFTVTSDGGQIRVALGEAGLSGLTIVVDPGHGGWDPGAVGRKGLSEKEVNLDMALRLQRLLEEAGARVVMTRSDEGSANGVYNGNTAGRRKELRTRCEMANGIPADLYVAVHCNSRGSAAKCGTETFYRKSDSAELARAIQEEMVKVLGRPDGGWHRHPESIIVLYGTEMPAALAEVGYLSNPTEEALLATPEFRQQAAQGIMDGIARYVRETGLLPRGESAPESPAPVQAPVPQPAGDGLSSESR